eukprot:CAMPEP_0118725396 /NCGR_PEP_ID=MMETSP0800-20121206/33116_1 /TAXON_ID=210618 ORGANISM="Striatella unipunctata, Strain CCMP2910" /NCGR_SAMPLE_ID=MMETSP0800 /ASSEMBLY_ACC=CAM_ASM_000638 /LENGTH=142 /DNA_ID=CAMNT_0006634089 /DNA_START=286 /DNA_END=711 /DNA_ORIENTATION=+
MKVVSANSDTNQAASSLLELLGEGNAAMPALYNRESRQLLTTTHSWSAVQLRNLAKGRLLPSTKGARMTGRLEKFRKPALTQSSNKRGKSSGRLAAKIAADKKRKEAEEAAKKAMPTGQEMRDQVKKTLDSIVEEQRKATLA